jgi:hypothetical protein
MTPEDFWKPFESTAQSFEEATQLIFSITEQDTNRQFAWRGVQNASWALHSSLYRRLLWSCQDAPTEEDLLAAEKRVISDAQAWGLHSGDRGRLSMFEFLATLQHYGAPTRFIDVTFSPYAALFFATETGQDCEDGRVFAVEVTGRLLNGNSNISLASWEQMTQLPWDFGSASADDSWCWTSYVWKPAGFDRRIAAQHGAFLLGGVPNAKPGAWPKAPTSSVGKWKIEEVRRATSVSARPHVISPSKGRHAAEGTALHSFRITANAKPQIRETLNRTFSLTHRAIYPDFPGFAACGVDWLPTKP